MQRSLIFLQIILHKYLSYYKKLLVALYYTLLLSHFLLFVFQFIPHSWFAYFAPTRTLINAAAKNCMNDFAYCSCSLAVSFSIACTSSYTKSTGLTLCTKYSSPCPMYSTLSYLCFFKFTIHCSEYILVIFRHFLARSQAIYNTQRESI